MEIHGDQPVDAGHAQHVGHELGADGYARFVFPVLPCPSEIRDYGHDALGRGALCRIDHQEKLHEIVRIGESRLDQEYMGTTYRLFVRNRKFPIGKVRDIHIAERTSQAGTYLFSQIPGFCTGKNQERCFFTHCVLLHYSFKYAAKVRNLPSRQKNKFAFLHENTHFVMLPPLSGRFGFAGSRPIRHIGRQTDGGRHRFDIRFPSHRSRPPSGRGKRRKERKRPRERNSRSPKKSPPETLRRNRKRSLKKSPKKSPMRRRPAVRKPSPGTAASSGR